MLVPQPSSSPNDPLNWPFWRKCALMLTITYGAGVVGAFGPIISAGLVQVAEALNTDTNALSGLPATPRSRVGTEPVSAIKASLGGVLVLLVLLMMLLVVWLLNTRDAHATTLWSLTKTRLRGDA